MKKLHSVFLLMLLVLTFLSNPLLVKAQLIQVVPNSNYSFVPPIEMNLTSSTSITIENTDTGMNNLIISLNGSLLPATDANTGLTLTTVPPSAANQWEIRYQNKSIADYPPVPFSIAPGPANKVTLQVRFTAKTVGASTMTLTIKSNDPNYPTPPWRTVTFNATVVNPIALNTVMVVDRSGSMAGPSFTGAGTITKIQALQQSMALYHSLSFIRGTDKIGAISYNSTATPSTSPYLALSLATSTLPPELDAGAILPPSGGLIPTGMTAIGLGIQEGINLFPNSAPATGEKNILLLLTDGMENVYPPNAITAAACITDPACAQAKQIGIYSIAFGSDAYGVDLLAISGTDKYFKVESDVTSGAPGANDLQNFFYKIWANAKGYTFVVDPTKMVDVANLVNTTIFETVITSSDLGISFLVLDEPSLRNLYTLELRDPAGNLVTSTSTYGGQSVSVVSNFNYTIYDIPTSANPDPALIGKWKLLLISKGNCSNIPNNESGPRTCVVPITFTSSVKSNLTFEVSALSNSSQPGAEITLLASSLEFGQLASIQQATVAVESPSGKKYGPIILSDTGTQGDPIANDKFFGGKFFNTSETGTYRFTFSAIVKNAKGELAPREDTRFVPLSFRGINNPSLQVDDCISCKLRWIAILIVVLLLLLILWRIRAAK